MNGDDVACRVVVAVVVEVVLGSRISSVRIR